LPMCPSNQRPHSSPSQTSPLPMAAAAGPELPRAGQASPTFNGFHFAAGEVPPGVAGIFVLTRQIGDFLYPALMGEAEDMATAIAAAKTADPQLAGEVDGISWMERANARQRAHILRELIGKFEPPLNIEHRKGRAAPAIAALIPDRASSDVQGVDLAAEIVVSEEELRALVRGFYAQAFADPLIGPIFKQAISDWEHHFDVVANFWSRTLLGTTRYKGNPFAPHVFLDLKPEFFDRWIAIFKPNAEKFLQPAAAHRAIAKVEHMSVCFQAGLFPPDLPPHVTASSHPTENATPPAGSETR